MSVWPYSLMRTIGYILLLGAPNFFSAKKRFKGATIDRSNVFLLTLFSRTFLLILLLGILLFLGLMIMGIVGYFFHDTA